MRLPPSALHGALSLARMCGMFAEVCREAVVACPLRQYGCLEMLPRRNIAQHLPVCAASGVLVSGVAAASPVARLCIRVSVLACAWHPLVIARVSEQLVTLSVPFLPPVARKALVWHNLAPPEKVSP